MVGEAAARRNQVPPQAPVVVDQVLINLAGLIVGEVRNALLQMEHAITTPAQAITDETTREGAPTENSHSSTMASRLREFTRITPPPFTLYPRPIRIPSSLWMRSTRYFVPLELMSRRRLN